MCRILLKSKLSANPFWCYNSPPVVFVGYRETVASSNETMPKHNNIANIWHSPLNVVVLRYSSQFALLSSQQLCQRSSLSAK